MTVFSGAAFAPATHSKPILFVPIGINLTAGDLDWAFDFLLMQRDGDGDRFANGPVGGGPSISMLGFAGAWMSGGPVFHTGASPLGGFFVSPKVTCGAFFIGRSQMMFDVLVGADVGYQLTVGRFFVAFVVGASVGVGVGDNDVWAGPLNLIPVSFVPSAFSPAVGLNLQLVRTGFTF